VLPENLTLEGLLVLLGGALELPVVVSGPGVSGSHWTVLGVRVVVFSKHSDNK
jgi:hypothetical protein